MEESDWKDTLAKYFEGLRVVDECRAETPEKFNQFCEFIAAPALESLSEELRKHGVGSKIRVRKQRSISFQVNFPKSSIDNFRYIISLPKHSFELRLKLVVSGRRNKKSVAEEKELPFMKNVLPSNILKISKEDLILDVIKHYKNFNFDALIKAE